MNRTATGPASPRASGDSHGSAGRERGESSTGSADGSSAGSADGTVRRSSTAGGRFAARGLRRFALTVALTVALAGLAVALGAGGAAAQEDVAVEDLPGEGTADDPYVVSTAAELQAMEGDLDAHYRLAADVDASATADWNDDRGFDPIGSVDEPFTGTLDGDEHAITGLTVRRHEAEAIGLFGALGEGATVERLAIEDAYLGSFEDTDDPRAGTVAGVSEGEVRQVAATPTFGDVTVQGGIVGENDGTVVQSYARVTWETRAEPAGGIAARNGGTIERSYAVAPRLVCSGHGWGGLIPCQDQGVVVGVDENGTTTDVYGHGPSDRFLTEGLQRDAATGTDAIDSMAALDFDGTWRETWAFPVLEWQYDGPDLPGVGLAHQPFAVATASDLDEVRHNASAHYVLVDDVDASATADWDAGSGFEPIGGGTQPFEGTLDGQGHAVEGLTVDRPGTDQVGLFAVVGTDGAVRDLGLEAADVTGAAAVGALAGANYGSVERVAVDGDVAGERAVGGVVGQQAGAVEDAIARADVAGTERVGGLAGSVDAGTVSGTLVTGSVDGERDATTGGLAGEAVGADASAAYWDVEATGQETSAVGSARSTGELTGDEPRTTTELAFVQPPRYEEPWVPTDGYPVLRWTTDPIQLPGNGTAADPYRIATASDLSSIRADLAAHYVLVDDVDASATADWNGGDGFEPIGGEFADENPRHLQLPAERFEGTLDGDGHVVRNLTIDRADESPVGLFRTVGPNATVRDVELLGASVRGREDVGGIAGISAGTVEGVGVSGEVVLRGPAGDLGDVGGLVVGESQGAIEDVGAEGTVSGQRRIGGVAGHAFAPVRDARAIGDVRGGTHVGGVVGYVAAPVRGARADADVHSQGNVRNGFGGVAGVARDDVVGAAAFGTVTVGRQASKVGGLVGRTGGDVRYAHARGDIAGSTSVGGLVGNVATQDARFEQVYATGAANGTRDVAPLVGYTRDDADVTVDGYWDVEASGRENSTFGTGLATAEMTGEDAVESMDALDFEAHWEPTESYPALDLANVTDGDDQCVAVDEGEACDLNDDGLYRDVTGDGRLGQDDVVHFFERQHRAAWQDPDLFDFSENGDVGHGDVVALFEAVAVR